MLHVCTLEFVSFSFTCFISFVLLFLQYRIVQISSENSFCNLFCMVGRSWPRMAEASRGAKGKALVQYSNGFEEEYASRMYQFQVLLPSGVSISLTLNNPGEEMLVRDLLHSVKRELNSAPVGGGKVREIHWDGNIFLTDLLDKKITDKIKFSNFDTKSTNILRLHVSP